jgi:hypothetical protein
MRTMANAAKVDAMRNFCAMVKRFVGSYVAAHTAFLTKRHHDGMEYMDYWQSMKGTLPPDQKDVVGLLENYQELRKGVLKSAVERLGTARANVASVFSPKNLGGLDNEDSVRVEEHFEKLLLWMIDQVDRLRRVYTLGAPSFLDSVADPQTLVIYALKGFRVLAAWYALKLAGGIFQGMYDRRVYTQEEEPPSPAVFVAMFLVADVTINLAVLLTLLFAKHLFKRVDNDFPIDGSLLSAWAFDYGMTTAVVAVVALIVGQVIRKKKYFRYKYEGDRGIRAMRQMLLYVVCVILFVPFFRLAYG